MKPLCHILSLFLLIAASSCEHKPLWLPESPIETTEIQYDWSRCSGDLPSGMSLYMYPLGTDEHPWLFNLSKNGGIINVPQDIYRAITYNNNTDGILFRNTDDYELFEIYTRRGRLLDGAQTPYTGALPPLVITEPVVITPDMMWTTATGVEITGGLVTLVPEQLTPRYTFNVTGVRNSDGVVDLCATLSGNIGGIYLNNLTPAEYPVTLPSQATIKEGNTITGSLITFGIPANPVAANILTLYFWLKDGSKYYCTFDVTSQIREAPDPLNVTINIDGLDLPEISLPPDDPAGGGIGVDVDSWHTIDIELKPFE